MPAYQDRDTVAAQNIEWARKGLSSVALGGSGWDDGTQRTSDAAEAFRPFTKTEMIEVKGAMAEEVQRDLRAVHFRYGFHNGGWESEAMQRGKYLTKTAMPERSTKDLQRTQFKLGSEKTEFVSGSRADLKLFSKTELSNAKPAMSDAVRKDLRAVHIFAPFDKNDWRSEAMSMGKEIKNTRRPERKTMNLRGSHIYLSEEPTNYTSDSKSELREFSKSEMADVRGSMAKAVQDDLRAVHFKLGTDKTVLDRHIRDRVQSGPVRPQSAPCLARLRPRSALR